MRPASCAVSFACLPLLFLGAACQKSHVQAMVEMDVAVAEAEAAARRGELAAMRERLRTLETLLGAPNVVGHIDQPAYRAMREHVQRLVQEIARIETTELALGRFEGLLQSCDACHAVYAERQYER